MQSILSIKYQIIDKMIDFVVPNNNENEFIAMAERLGYKGIYFLYNLDDYLNKSKKFEIKTNKIKVNIGIIADYKNIYKIKNIPEKQSFSGRRKSFAFSSELKDEDVFVAVKSSDNNKEIIEKSGVNMIFSFEENSRRDFIHQRASGLNHVLCKSAKENNVTMGFSVKSILDAENKQELLGRIMQNMNLCRKFKVKTTIASLAQKPLEMREIHDLTSLFEILGSK